MLNLPTIIATVMFSVYLVYYAVILTSNKKYRQFVSKNNVVTIISTFVILVVSALLVVFGMHCAGGSGGMMSGGSVGCSLYSWILLTVAGFVATIFVLSSVYTQVKLRGMPDGSTDRCPAVNLFAPL
jgi:uncharacterized membrane protein (DUF485 family)